MPVVMGTAGHIDHGKTTLVRALTGTDCDRLAEEKRRGITIELGFAELILPGGRRISVVDVPGHERFVRTMVAGAAGVDFVLLVIAADEGVMPQTREHLEICALLGIRAGIVALTKADAVDEEFLDLVREDVAAFLEGGILEGAPVIPVSAHSGMGMDALIAALAVLEAGLEPVRSRDLFRLPVDRVFSLRGHGTIVAGTMISGQISVGDTVEFSPSGLISKVRGLQSHGMVAEKAQAGRRIAVNVPDVAVEQVRKGEMLSRQNTLFPRDRWVLRLSCLSSSPRPLRHRMEVHFHHGSCEMQARLYFADRDKLMPGESCLCECRFPEAAAAVFGDHCVVRSFSPLRTVAGGIVLNPLGAVMRRRDPGFAECCRLLSSIDEVSHEERVYRQLLCTEGGEEGIAFSRLRVLSNLDAAPLEAALALLSSKGRTVCFDKEQRLYLADVFLTKCSLACEESSAAHHARHPEKQGIRRSELISGWGKGLAPKLAHFTLERLVRQGRLVAEGEYLRLPNHAPTFSRDQAPLRDALLAAYRQAGLNPPNRSELLKNLRLTAKDAAALFDSLRAEGQLVRVSEELWFAAEHLAEAEALLRRWFESRESIDVAEFRGITGLSRKYLVPLLEYFDARKVTLRVGDTRVLRQPTA
jgi:selenocysteine-specific elongation factor